MTAWITPRPVGFADWTLCACMIVLAVPVLLIFGPPVALLRAFGGKG